MSPGETVRWGVRASLPLILICALGVSCGRIGFDDNDSEFDNRRDGGVEIDVDAIVTVPDAGIPPDAGITTDWWDVTWRQRLELSLSNPTGEQVVDFPLFVRFSDATFAAINNVTNGDDLRFIGRDGITILPYEIAHWGDTDALIWVRVTDLMGSGATNRIWLYFDNPSPPVPPDPRAVWSNGYRGVWHLSETPSDGAVMTDSTANQKHGTASGSISSKGVASPLDGGIVFDGASHIRIPSAAVDVLALTDRLTLEAWVRRDSANDAPSPATIVGRQLGNGFFDSYTMLGRVGAHGTLVLCTSECVSSSALAMPQGAWVHVATTFDETGTRMYVNGALVDSYSNDHQIEIDNNDVTIGGQENGPGNTLSEFWTGGIDEVRISDVARSEAWMELQYLSMTDQLASSGAIETL